MACNRACMRSRDSRPGSKGKSVSIAIRIAALFILSLTSAILASNCLADATEPSYLFGMSMTRYPIKQSDGVFPTGYYSSYTGDFVPAPGLFQSSGWTFGFRFAYLKPATPRLRLRYDAELELGLLNRGFNPYFAEASVVGFQAFVGPQSTPHDGRVSYYLLGGIRHIRFAGHESWEQSGSADIIWYGTGGYTDLWAEILNEWESTGSATIPGYDAVQLTALGLCLGSNFVIWKPPGLAGGAMGGYLEYLPMFGGGLRNEFRLGLSITLR